MTETTGLFSTSDQAPIALTGVAVHATITGHAAQVTVAQHYVNRETRPIEAVYVFPLPSDAAIAGFVAVVDGRRIEGRVEERDRAFDSYDDALAAGHGAFLLDQERPNIFTASVGNLRPGATDRGPLRARTGPVDGPRPAWNPDNHGDTEIHGGGTERPAPGPSRHRRERWSPSIRIESGR